MTYLTGLAEAWEIHDLCRTDYLPEYPKEVDHHELMRCEGFEDAKTYMRGELDEPEYPDDLDYMTGWNNGLDNFFINQELFGETVDNSLVKS